MQISKEQLLGFISKYYLSGNIESVIWNISSNKTLSTKFMLPDWTLVGGVTLKDFDYDDDILECGIFDTSRILKMISVLDNPITINFLKTDNIPHTLKLKDKNTKIEYMLAELSVIPNVVNIQHIPEFDINIKLTDELITRFIKAISALPTAEYFYVSIDSLKNESYLIIEDQNNNIFLNIEVEETNEISKLLFSTNIFKSILNVNKEFNSCIFQISSEGLLQIGFSGDIFNSLYYLVPKDKVNSND